MGADGTATGELATGALTGGAVSALPYSSEFTNLGINDSYSVFGDVRWTATPKLELTAGVRVLIEKRKSGYSAIVPVPVLPTLLPDALRDQLYAALPSLRRSLIPGQTDTGAYVDGYGPIPGDLARDLAAGATWLRRLYADAQTGALVAMESTRRKVPDGMARFLEDVGARWLDSVDEDFDDAVRWQSLAPPCSLHTAC